LSVSPPCRLRVAFGRFDSGPETAFSPTIQRIAGSCRRRSASFTSSYPARRPNTDCRNPGQGVPAILAGAGVGQDKGRFTRCSASPLTPMMGRPKADPGENRDPGQGNQFPECLTLKCRLENGLQELCTKIVTRSYGPEDRCCMSLSSRHAATKMRANFSLLRSSLGWMVASASDGLSWHADENPQSVSSGRLSFQIPT
jgi:hypothetical protein